MADSITPWETDLAVSSGHLQPTAISAPSGSHVVVLGSEQRNHFIVAEPGDYSEISQTAEWGGQTGALIRSSFTFAAPALLPIGVLWRVSIYVNGAEVVGRSVTNTGDQVDRFDLAANVFKLAGDNKLAFRLSLVGVGEPQLVELPGVFIDQLVFDGPIT